ncbi:hypothetical protein OG535_23805 [Kitasatospora sp. NBC_00085]|uniref:hypothetical protein n=1 Tax=Kitasatospora sp. NBC_00085 TaxID=2903566 RepID=UPI003244A49E
MADRESTAQVWGAAVVVGSALVVVAAYLINGAPLVLAVAGVEVLLLMAYVGRRWRLLRQPVAPRGHQWAGGAPDAAHCERCRRAREALDARQARRARSRPYVDGPYVDRSGADRPYADRPYADRPHADRSGASRDHAPCEGAPHERVTRERSADARPARGDRPDHGHPPRPASEWTAERAATRSSDRPAARHGVPGSAGRAVRHQ